jgi:hypothetical protein
MPAGLLLLSVFVYYGPLLMKRWTGGIFFARAMGLAFFGFIIIVHVILSKAMFDRKYVPIGSGGDRIITYGADFNGDQTGTIAKALDRIGRIGKDKSVLVFPEGVMLNYLSRRANGCRYISFMPPELAIFGEDTMLKAISAQPPDYVIMLKKDAKEYGYNYFGQDFGCKIFGWIKENYTMLETLGDLELNSTGFGLFIAKRNK